MYKGNDVIRDQEIQEALAYGKRTASDTLAVQRVVEKAKLAKGLTFEEAAVLIQVEDPAILAQMAEAAKSVKEAIYGRRIVMFAPLYVGNYCVNQCKYCGYQAGNKELTRRRLELEEIDGEIEALLALGHKRIVLEAGEDPLRHPIEYILDCMERIYAYRSTKGENIRRINVNIAATTAEEYRKLKDAGIGTYILFQESYHRPTYEAMHPAGPKANYDWHTTAMHRAMEGGIDDVGCGVLFGLYDHRYETIAMLMHAEHLEKTMGVGPHTLSVPRLRPAVGVTMAEYPHLVSDEEFKKIVMVLRLAVPYAGLILSTREDPVLRDEIIALGVSQVSSGSCTGVGGYQSSLEKDPAEKPQFEVGDHRTPEEMIQQLCENGYIPSYCTACYREGRTGDRFMELAQSGQIQNVCQPNALLTLEEYLLDHADEATLKVARPLLEKELETIPDERIRELTKKRLAELKAGKRDLYF